MLLQHLQEQDIHSTTLPVHVKETIDLLHEFIRKNLENQLDDTNFLKVKDLFTKVDYRTDLV